jgi:hypothetical protein
MTYVPSADLTKCDFIAVFDRAAANQLSPWHGPYGQLQVDGMNMFVVKAEDNSGFDDQTSCARVQGSA